MTISKPHLLWAAYPLGIPALIFGFIAAVNWGYESKLLALRTDVSGWTEQYVGPILLVIAIIMALIGSLILLAMGAFWPKSRTGWFLVPVTVVTILLVFPSLFIIILGPAGITMIEQTNSSPSK